MRRIALVYSTNPTHGIQGMDMIRWVAMGHRFRRLGYKVKLVTDRRRALDRIDGLHLSSAHRVVWSDFDVIKVSYQASIELVEPHPNLVVRMCRVVDEELPKRDGHRRADMLRQQQRISEIASIVSFNDEENAARWRRRYGSPSKILIVPTGCPETLPAVTDNPFPPDRRIVLFTGSLTAHRFPGVLNALARRLRAERDDIEVHFVGKNSLQHYAGESEPLDPEFVHVHGPVSEEETWSFVLNAHAGLALAPSEHAFESELSKIYYYLRGGLPVVTESSVPNRTVAEEVGLGAVARYGDLDDLVAKTLVALSKTPRQPAIMQHMADRHSWSARARIYEEALQERWASRAN